MDFFVLFLAQLFDTQSLMTIGPEGDQVQLAQELPADLIANPKVRSHQLGAII